MLRSRVLSYCMLASVGLFAVQVVAAPTKKTIVSPKACKNLTCVRQGIDGIDQKIVELLGRRLQYVKRAGELKTNIRSVHDQARENKILQKVGEQAKVEGYPSTIAENVFRTILKQANIYEQRYHSYAGLPAVERK